MDEALGVDLTKDERAMLRWGLLDWGGPANPTDSLARVMGFESLAAFQDERRGIAELVSTGVGCRGTTGRAR